MSYERVFIIRDNLDLNNEYIKSQNYTLFKILSSSNINKTAVFVEYIQYNGTISTKYLISKDICDLISSDDNYSKLPGFDKILNLIKLAFNNFKSRHFTLINVSHNSIPNGFDSYQDNIDKVRITHFADAFKKLDNNNTKQIDSFIIDSCESGHLNYLYELLDTGL